MFSKQHIKQTTLRNKNNTHTKNSRTYNGKRTNTTTTTSLNNKLKPQSNNHTFCSICFVAEQYLFFFSIKFFLYVFICYVLFAQQQKPQNGMEHNKTQTQIQHIKQQTTTTVKPNKKQPNKRKHNSNINKTKK